MFDTRAVLISGPSGHFDLVVYVEVPTTCFHAGLLKHGLPSGMVGIPELEYYNLTLEHDDKSFCGQLVHDVSATAPGVTLPSGKYAFCVIVLYKGAVVGSATARPAADDATNLTKSLTPAPGGSVIVPGSVSATVFGGIIGPPRLEASCLVITPTPGYAAKLTPVKPQGFNPTILILQLSLTPPSGPVIEVISFATAHYTELNYKRDYTDVTVIYGQQTVTVPVLWIYGFGIAELEKGNHVRDLLP